MGDGATVEQDLRALVALRAEADEVDRPGEPAVTYEQLVQEHATLESDGMLASMWVARGDAGIAAFGWLGLPRQENTHKCIVHIAVRPGLRRQGIGTAFLRALLPVASAAGRREARGGFRGGAAAEAWAGTVGFATVHGFLNQELVFGDVDPGLWDVPVAEGYSLREWVGAAPEELLASFAAARQAMHDAPPGDSAWQAPDWTPQKVREREAQVASLGAEQRLVVAVRDADLSVAGLTEVFTSDRQPDRAQQSDTAVLREHRGRGLGRALKATMLTRLVAQRPALVRITTQTAVDNVHMARVSREVGFRDLWVDTVVEAELDRLAQHGA